MKNLLVLFLLFFYILQSLKAQEEILEENDFFIFSHSDSFNFWEESNAAILISDKDSIKELKELFFNNELLGEYLCGYDYQIQFMTNNGKKIEKKLYLNTECDIYKRDHKRIEDFINSFIKRIKNNPTHYIYNLKVDVKTPSDYIISQLKDDDLNAFLLSDYYEQFPKLKLTYCEPDIQNRTLEDAERRYKEIMTNIEFDIYPIDSSRIYRTTKYQSKYVDFKTNTISRLYYFPTTTDMNSVIKEIEGSKISYLFAESCSQYYYLQLLSKDSIQKLSALLRRYSFINDVTEAREGFVYPECDLYIE